MQYADMGNVKRCLGFDTVLEFQGSFFVVSVLILKVTVSMLVSCWMSRSCASKPYGVRSQSVRHICSGTARQLHCFGIRAGSTEPCWRFVSSLSPETCWMQPTILVFVTSLLLSRISFILSASLYVSKRGAYWDRLYRDVVGRWLVGCHARALWPNGAS